ncbi:MAG: nuclear transport factor 2 family protein [Candidatus Pacebacteria bacterium]|nr:nuclear transport factor 2 family protein [Candidatus Paceibacterota bacterium]
MNTRQVAEKLVALFNSGHMEAPYEEPYRDLFSPDIVSREQGGEFREVFGFDGIKKKADWWEESFELHSASMSEPVVADNYFSVSITMDTTHKPSGHRETMSELAVYKVKDGKIVWEEFFYLTDEEM